MNEHETITIIMTLDEASRLFAACLLVAHGKALDQVGPQQWRNDLRAFAWQLWRERERVA